MCAQCKLCDMLAETSNNDVKVLVRIDPQVSLALDKEVLGGRVSHC